MADEYIGSIAQNNVQFVTTLEYNTNPGVQYQKVMIFIGESEDGDFFEGTPPAVNAGIEVNATTYTSLTKGTLKTALADFFAGTKISTAWLIVWDDTVLTEFGTEGLEAAYTANKTKAFFKLVHSATNAAATFVALATLAVNDKLYSQCWYSTSDATIAIVASVLAVSNATAKVVYHSDEDRNGALAQLGVTLSTINLETGFCVGNSLFFNENNVIDASGTADADGGTNIAAALRATLEAAKVSFFTYTGNGTGATQMEGNLLIGGENAAAEWCIAFIEFVGKIKTAELISTMNTWRNNDTYQAILLITQTLLNQFNALGRFSNATVKNAPNFNALPPGPSITIPQAWEGDFVDAVTSVTVYGTLTIQV
jgi:hypothetical protein